jgi:enoyl-[acyl-carrier protein] reductase II
MFHTPLCDVLGIQLPILCAPFGPWDQVELAAAVSEAGGLGSVGTAVRPVEELRDQWNRLRELTDKPFAINHTVRPFNEEAFEATLDFRPPAISFHLAVPEDLIQRAHEQGILWIQQVVDRSQAEHAVEAGADVIIAQGGEAGGHAGWVSTMVFVPEVVDVAGDVPVVAAGGIADGRGLAAAFALGAQGVNMGTRFLASTELRVDDEWKQLIVEADALDAVKIVNSERALPPYSREVPPIAPRALSTPLIEQLRDDPDSVEPSEVGPQLVQAVLRGGGHEYMPFAGQSVALIHEVLPAAEIMGRILGEAEAALAAAPRAE